MTRCFATILARRRILTRFVWGCFCCKLTFFLSDDQLSGSDVLEDEPLLLDEDPDEELLELPDDEEEFVVLELLAGLLVASGPTRTILSRLR